MQISKVSLSEERSILENLIFSKGLLAEVRGITNPNYFRNEKYIKIAKWVVDYFDNYEDAPRENIQEFLLEVQPDHREIYAEIIGPFIERNLDAKTNDDFFIERTIQFYKKRELEMISANVSYLISKGQIQEAEQELLSFNKPSRLTLSFFNPFDDVAEVFEAKDDGLFKFSGGLGEMIGPFNRGWLVAVAGGFKRSKTWSLQEFYLSSIFNRLRTVFFSLEMKKVDMKDRLYHRILSLADKKGLYRIPVFDCLKNQNGKCSYPTRVGSGILFKDGERPNPALTKSHKVCTSCIGSDDFEPTTWYELVDKEEYEIGTVFERIGAFKNLYHAYAQMRCFPRFSASIYDIKHEVNLLAGKFNFLPDVIIVDYADIVKPAGKASGFEKEDEIWMLLAQMASEFNCLVVTATQLTREGLDAIDIDEKHMSKWIGKLAHVDVMLALNQTPQEKANNIIRWNVLEHRHHAFNKLDTCHVLQDLNIGQSNMGSYLRRFK
jgi:hypothetical protein